ncbi:MAG TPA: FAD-binding protein, partial [bacterium]|nr:FAD-binding protein [bacterium]
MCHDVDFVVIGSGFGGSVSALRLAEKGYNVLVIEKGKHLRASDFPKTNWNVRRWMWIPLLRCFGLFKLTFFRHVTVLSGVGVGGGSLVYANTLPVPKENFFTSPSWSHLADWKEELKPFYPLALRMLGATRNTRMDAGDFALQRMAKK